MAESYTLEGGEVSRWWVDLSRELAHYIEYGVWLEEETLRWRNTKIDCYFEEGIGGCLLSDCYDEYVVSCVMLSYV